MEDFVNQICPFACNELRSMVKYITGTAFQAYFSNASETARNTLDELTHSPKLQKIGTPKYQTWEESFDMCLRVQEMI